MREHNRWNIKLAEMVVIVRDSERDLSAIKAIVGFEPEPRGAPAWRLLGRTAGGQRRSLVRGRNQFGKGFGVKLKLYQRERPRLQRENDVAR